MEWFYKNDTHRFTSRRVFCSIYANDWWNTYYFNNAFYCWSSKKFNADPILTFDQLLYQKAYEIQWKKSKSSKLKRIVLRLGRLHTSLSFLDSIGNFMCSSGIREVLETFYGSDSVPHMLSGWTISRAFWGHLIVSGVLYAIIIPDVYECPLQDHFSAVESKKDLFSNKLPESKLDNFSQKFDQLKQQMPLMLERY